MSPDERSGPSSEPQVQNRRGEWVPSIPLPLYTGFGTRFSLCQCKCGQTFRKEVQYRGHYALVHILGLS
jgi:hypothetical protein